MKYLSKDQILLINSMVVDETGGSHGVRDTHAILSLTVASAQSVFGKELYPTIFEKAALYARDVIMNHPFIDGNKRTGVTAASVFLENNGYVITAAEGEFERLALRIIAERLSIEKIADWFKKHSKKIKKK